MQAMRAAGLVDDKQYYASKLGFLNLNSQEQEAALQKEIDRMQLESFTGKNAVKESLDNSKKIADAQAQLDKVRADAAAGVVINGIQEVAANAKINQSYIDAEKAQTDYLSILREKNAIKLASLSIGDLEASQLAGQLQIDKKYIDEEKALNQSRSAAESNGKSFAPGTDAKARYDYQLALIQQFHAAAISDYAAYYADLLKKQGDWSVGAAKALQNYYDESQNIMKQSETVVTKAFKGMEDALVNFVMTGKLDFKSLADSIITDLIRIQIKSQITGPLAGAIGSGGGMLGWLANLFGGGVSDIAAGTGGMSFAEAAAAGVIAMASGGDFMVTKPTLFLAGEAGPERATFGGAGGSGGIPPMVFNVTNTGGAPSQLRQNGPPVMTSGKLVVSLWMEEIGNNPAARNAIAGALR